MKPKNQGPSHSRRLFLTRSMMGTAGSFVAPMFVPRTYLFGSQVPPSRKIQVAQIGCGRMGMADLRDTMKHDLCRMVAVCDLDSKRLEAAKSEVAQNYAGKGESRVDVKAGDVVGQGQLLGLSGSTGRVTGPHLHWAIKFRNVLSDDRGTDIWLDPMLMLDLKAPN